MLEQKQNSEFKLWIQTMIALTNSFLEAVAPTAWRIL